MKPTFLSAKISPRTIHKSVLTFLLLVIANSACSPMTSPIPTLTPTLVVPTSTSTPTTVWFPPTSTWTPIPTSTNLPPTPEMRPGIGSIIFEDMFSSSNDWILMEKDGGSVRLGKEELTFVTSQKRIYVYSIRQEPSLSNFYAEITANPIFCRDLDEYGLLFRVNSPSDYYRFGVSCDGQVRLDRILSGNASSPQPWIQSGSVPIGGPSLVQLGIWAVGSEFRLFINDDLQFTVQDNQLASGTIGLFSRSFSDEAFTVNFRSLKIWEVNP